MQQATYRVHRQAASAYRSSGLGQLELLGRLVGELTALASLGLALAGGLLIAASYLV